MIGTHASINGIFVPVQDAHVPVDDMAFAYGFGVYESLRVRKGMARHIAKHLDRLFQSAAYIGLVHSFTQKNITAWVHALTEKNNIEAANLKILLIGNTPEPQLYMFLVAPKYVEKKEYRNGVKTVTVNYERYMPQAKSLNMLPSMMAFQKAKEANAFDALLINKQGNIVEGTRTNFFAMQGNTIMSPPLNEILDGITRRHVLACAKEHGYTLTEAPIPLDDISSYDGAFLTNTSSKIVPIKQIDDVVFDDISASIHDLRG